MDEEPISKQPKQSMNIPSGSNIPVPKRFARSPITAEPQVEKTTPASSKGLHASISISRSIHENRSHIPVPIQNPQSVASPRASTQSMESSKAHTVTSPRHLPAPGYYSRFKEVASPSKEQSPSGNAANKDGQSKSFVPVKLFSQAPATSISTSSPATISSPVTFASSLPVRSKVSAVASSMTPTSSLPTSHVQTVSHSVPVKSVPSSIPATSPATVSNRSGTPLSSSVTAIITPVTAMSFVPVAAALPMTRSSVPVRSKIPVSSTMPGALPANLSSRSGAPVLSSEFTTSPVTVSSFVPANLPAIPATFPASKSEAPVSSPVSSVPVKPSVSIPSPKSVSDTPFTTVSAHSSGKGSSVSAASLPSPVSISSPVTIVLPTTDSHHRSPGSPMSNISSMSSTSPVSVVFPVSSISSPLQLNEVASSGEVKRKNSNGSVKESDMKRNFLEMLSKSEERRKKTRVLPTLQATSPTKSASVTPPAPHDHSEPSPASSSRAGEISKPELYGGVNEKAAEQSGELPLLSQIKAKQPVEQNVQQASTSPPNKGHTEQVNIDSVMEKMGSLGIYTVYTDSGREDLAAQVPLETLVQCSSSSDVEDRNLTSLAVELESGKGDSQLQQNAKLHGSSDESVAESGGSFVSHQSLPVTMEKVNSLSAISGVDSEEVVITSLPDLGDNQRTVSGLPGSVVASQNSSLHLLLKSQIGSLKAEKEELTSQLKQAQTSIVLLETENYNLKSEAERTAAEIESLHETSRRDQGVISKLHQSHTEEVSSITKQMRMQLQNERERLLNQIRELTITKAHATAEVEELKESLSEAQDLAASSSTNLERSEVKHKAKLESMKVEIQTQQELYEELEKAHVSLLKSNREAEERVGQLVSEKSLLEEKLGILESSQIEDDSGLKKTLRATEKRVSELQREKYEAVLAVETKAIDDIATIQVMHKTALDDLRKQLDNAQTQILNQNQRISHLQDQQKSQVSTEQVSKQLAGQKGSRQIWSQKEASKTSPIPVSVVTSRYLTDTIAFKNKRSYSVPYERRLKTKIQHGHSFKMGTSSGRSSRMHAASSLPRSLSPASTGFPTHGEYLGGLERKEDMTALFKMLEGDGFNPSEATPEEVIVHLWRLNEQTKEELQEEKEEKEKMASRVVTMKEKIHQTSREVSGGMKSSHKVLRGKLEEMLQKTHMAEEQTASMRQKHHEILAENQELKGRLTDLRGKLMDKSVQMNNMEADLAGTKRDVSHSKKELSCERQQKSMLQSKVSALEDQVITTKQELWDVEHEAKKKLSSAGDHVKQTRQEVAGLKAKIGELEGEVNELKQKLSQTTEQRATLQVQLDSNATHVSLLEATLHKEKNKIREVESKLAALEADQNRKKSDLKEAVAQNKELQLEIGNYRSKVKIYQETVDALENRLQSLQTENSQYKSELTKITAFITELEARLTTTNRELKKYQELAKEMQEAASTTKSNLETTTMDLQVERQNNMELQSMVNTLNINLERSGKKMEGLDMDISELKKQLMTKKRELDEIRQENHSLNLDLKHALNSSSTLQEELHELERDLTAKDRDLALTKEKLAAMSQKFSMANSDIESYKHQIDLLKNQLSSSESEHARLVDGSQICEAELNAIKQEFAAVKKHLSEKTTEIQYMEDEIRSEKHKSELITNELSSAKVAIQTLMNTRANLEKELDVKTSEMAMESEKLHSLNREYRVKEEELERLRKDNEKMQCCLLCEREQSKTLHMECEEAKSKLSTISQTNKRLQDDLEKFMEDAHAKSLENQTMINELQQKVSVTTNQLELLKGQYTLLDTEDRRARQLLESVSKEYAEMKGKLSLTLNDLEQTQMEKQGLQNKVRSLQHKLEGTSNSLAVKVSDYESMNNKLLICQRQLANALQNAERERVEFESQQSAFDQLQGDVQKLNDALTSVNYKLENTLEERNYEKKRADTLYADLSAQQEKFQQASESLYAAKKQLADMRDTSLKARDSYNQHTCAMRSTHEEEKAVWKSEKETLQREYEEARRRILALEKERDSFENKLAVCSVKLANAEEKCGQLEANAHSAAEARNQLEAMHQKLEDNHAAMLLKYNETVSKNEVHSSEVDRLKAEVDAQVKEREQLREKMQLQRETAATTLNKIQKQSTEATTELHSKIQQLSDQIRDAHESLRESQQEVARIKGENHTLNSCLNEEAEKNRMLRDKIQEQLTTMRHQEDQLSMLKQSGEHEKNTKFQLQSTLSEEKKKRQTLESELAQRTDVVTTTGYELGECKKSLMQECAKNSQLRQEIEQLKDLLQETHAQLDNMKGLQKEIKHQSEIESYELMQKYQTEKKAMKDRIKDLQAELEHALAQSKGRIDEACKLATNNKILIEEQREMAKKLEAMTLKYHDKRDECNEIKAKLQAIEVQVVRYQTEVNSLEKAKMEMEDYKRKQELKSRKEMQKVLAEVTDHMEQQYTAHRALEKLRSDNETIALKEKERMIGHLKDELKQKKQDSKQDKLRMEQMRLESSYLKHQHKDQDKSRRRLEDRLENVSDTLSRTFPHPGAETTSAYQLPQIQAISRLTKARHSIGL